MSSSDAPLWKRILLRLAPWLFKRCPAGNRHWRTDNACICVLNCNGHGIYWFRTNAEFACEEGSWVYRGWYDA